MGKRRFKLFCIGLLFVFLISGCSNSLKEENDRLNKESGILEQEKAALQNQVDSLKEQVEMLKGKLDEQVSITAAAREEASKDMSNIYPVYSIDDGSNRIISYYISMDNKLTINQKLNIIADKLSKYNFRGLPIEVTLDEGTEGKKIAMVNLKEIQENQGVTDYTKLKGSTWAAGYFQGSFGGTQTSVCLIETFLQRDYKGEWIDGIKFLYENKICDFEHVSRLKDITYR